MGEKNGTPLDQRARHETRRSKPRFVSRLKDEEEAAYLPTCLPD